jgi:hypothetical protein
MLRGLVVVGPSGDLGQYSVVTFLERGDRQRMNWLIFPRGRITSKGVLELDPRDYSRLLETIIASPAMHAGVPEPTGTEADTGYQVLAADWSGGEERVWYSATGAVPGDLQGIYAALEALLARGTQTYGNYGLLTTDEILTQIGF